MHFLQVKLLYLFYTYTTLQLSTSSRNFFLKHLCSIQHPASCCPKAVHVYESAPPSDTVVVLSIPTNVFFSHLYIHT